MSLRVTTPAFDAGARIPAKHSGEGQDVSPALQWGSAPAGTKEICILCDDPDAPRDQPWVHWLVSGISPERTGLAEGETEGLVLGQNDFGHSAYGGPMPPKGHGVHHYHFRVMALRAPSGLRTGFSKGDLLHAAHGRILAEGELVGTYERK